MATILRSSRYVRHFAVFARRRVLSQSNANVAANLLSQSQGVPAALASNLNTRPAIQHSQYELTLERSLNKLDQEARRHGRILKKDLEEILEDIRTTKSVTSSQALMVIRCCGKLMSEELPDARTELVNDVWSTLQGLGVPMDVSHYNALLCVYLENEHEFSPVEFLTELEKKGIEPNRVTYQRLITRYCQQGDIEGATRILEFMREKQLPVNENVFNALIMGHSQANDMESAVGILEVMRQANLEPSTDTYAALLCGYGKKGDIESIKRVLAECQANDVLLLDSTLMDVIYCLVMNGHEEYIDDILSTMTKGVGYNQDAVSLVLRLVNSGKHDVALKIMLTMPKPINVTNDFAGQGHFYVKQLVKRDVPTEKIVEVCQYLEKEGYNTRAFMIAVEASLLKGDLDQSFSLMSAWKEAGAEIKQHYFWPLFVAQGRKQNNEGILAIIDQMNDVFGIIASNETVREYIVPFYNGTPEDIEYDLRSAGVSPGSSISAIVHNLIRKNEMGKAAAVASGNVAYYSPYLFRRFLVLGLARTGDVESFVTILRHICEGLSKRKEANDDDQPMDSIELVGSVMNDIPRLVTQNTIGILTKVLNALVNEGLGITSEAATKLERTLGQQLTPALSEIISKLTSGTLVPRPITISSNTQRASLSDVSRLTQLKANLETKGESTHGLKKQLLTIYCRNKNVEKVEELLEEMRSQEFTFTGGVLAQLIDLYTSSGNLEMAEKYMNELKDTSGDFLLDDSKLLKYVELLMANKRFDEGLQILETHKLSKKEGQRPFSYDGLCWRILNSIAEAGDVDHLKQAFDTITRNGYVETKNIILGPLVKVHILRNDLKSALDVFEWACNTHKCTPYKNELTIQLITAEDAESLQRLTDLSTKVHGEMNSLYDLIFSFVECGRLRQARKILETPGLRARPDKLNNRSERYRQEGMITPLEGLIEVTKDLKQLDRAHLYNDLLLAYSETDDWNKALGLWTKMQEEDVQASDEFLRNLASLLRKNDQPVPFVEPQLKSVDVQKTPKQQSNSSEQLTKQARDEEPPTATQQFRRALRRGDLVAAQEAIPRMEAEGQSLSVMNKSLLIEALVREGRLKEAIKITDEVFDSGVFPKPNIFTFLLNKIAATGDVETLEKYSTIPEKLKRFISFDNKICHAYIEAGRGEEYLTKLGKELEETTEVDLDSISERFPRGAALGILEKCPELSEKFEALARKFAARGIISPMNVLWIHRYLQNNPDADAIWNEYLANCPKVMFRKILDTGIKNNDLELLEKWVKKMETSAISDQGRGSAYSGIITVYNNLEKYDEGLQALEKALKDVSLECFNRRPLFLLKQGLEKSGKSFPYTIPKADKRDNSSSSSDDEDITQQSKQ